MMKIKRDTTKAILVFLLTLSLGGPSAASAAGSLSGSPSGDAAARGDGSLAPNCSGNRSRLLPPSVEDGMRLYSSARASRERAAGSVRNLGASPALENPDGSRSALKTTFLASAFLLGSLAAIFEIESDRAYSRYLGVASPIKMASQYDKAERYRKFSSAALLAAEICAVGFVVLSLSEKPKQETEPGPVRITLDVGISGAGVSVLW